LQLLRYDGTFRLHSSGSLSLVNGDLATSVAPLSASSLSAAATCSNGSAHLVCADIGIVERSWNAHNAEAWSVDASCDMNRILSSPLVLTGGDDRAVRLWDARDSARRAALSPPEHGAGVCCVRFASFDPCFIATSSYDGYVRIFDARVPTKPAWWSAGSESGIWQFDMSFSSLDIFTIVAACTFSGVEVHTPDGAASAEAKTVPDELVYGACMPMNGVALTAHFKESVVHTWSLG
jgi:diphthamide biosynthesis protein 7